MQCLRQILGDWRQLQRWFASAMLLKSPIVSTCRLCDWAFTLLNVDSSQGSLPCFTLSELVASGSRGDVLANWQLSVEMWKSSLAAMGVVEEEEEEAIPLICVFTVVGEALPWVTQVKERGLSLSLVISPLCPPLTCSSVYRSTSTSPSNAGWLPSSFFLVLSMATCWH